MNKNAVLDRQNKLLEALEVTAKIRVEEAMEFLGVSRSTVSRLLADMERKGLILRIQGGATLARDNLEYAFEKIEKVKLEEKKKIGYRAADLVASGDTIFLDSGTTLPHMCAALVKRMEAGELTNVRVFTASLGNLNVLQKVKSVYLIGGEYRHSRRDFQGFIAEEAIRPLHFTKCFLGADGIDWNHGLTTVDFASASLNRIVFANSFQRYVVADSSKFDKIASVQYADIAGIHGMVTDGTGSIRVDALTEKGVRVYLTQ